MLEREQCAEPFDIKVSHSIKLGQVQDITDPCDILKTSDSENQAHKEAKKSFVNALGKKCQDSIKCSNEDFKCKPLLVETADAYETSEKMFTINNVEIKVCYFTCTMSAKGQCTCQE